MLRIDDSKNRLQYSHIRQKLLTDRGHIKEYIRVSNAVRLNLMEDDRYSRKLKLLIDNRLNLPGDVLALKYRNPL